MNSLMKTVLCASATAIAAGCGLKTYSSGVMQLGPDTYTVTADDLNESTAKQAALRQAQERCTSMSREILVTNMKLSRGGRAAFDVTFRCLTKDDPEFKRPNYTKEPDVVIEDKRK